MCDLERLILDDASLGSGGGGDFDRENLRGPTERCQISASDIITVSMVSIQVAIPIRFSSSGEVPVWSWFRI